MSRSSASSTYSTVLDKWLHLDAAPIVNGQFEQFDFIANGTNGTNGK